MSGFSTNFAAFLTTPSSSNLVDAVTDETGTGALVFATSPTLVTPALGTPSAGVLNSCTTQDTPAGGSSVVNKNYVDSVAAGLSWKESVKVATVANITLTGAGTTAIDSISIASGDRILVKNQSSASENGIYVSDGTDLLRADDMDNAAEFAGSAVFIQEGSFADQGYVCTNDGDVNVNTDAVAFTQFTGTGAFNFRVGLLADGNNIDTSFSSYVAMESEFSASAAQNNSASSPVSISYRFINESDVGNGQAPVSSANSDLAREQLFFQVFLNGILLMGRLVSDSASAQNIVDLLSGEGTGQDAGIEYDYVSKITNSSGDFELYMQTSDIDSSDLLTLSYAK